MRLPTRRRLRRRRHLRHQDTRAGQWQLIAKTLDVIQGLGRNARLPEWCMLGRNEHHNQLHSNSVIYVIFTAYVINERHHVTIHSVYFSLHNHKCTQKPQRQTSFYYSICVGYNLQFLTDMRFWRRSNYVEPESLFQVNDDSLSDEHADNLTSGNHVPSGLSSLCSSSSSYTCLAADPMHEGNNKVSTDTGHDHGVCGIAVDDLCIGDVVSDEQGMDWVIR
jgi:hypothetical protein